MFADSPTIAAPTPPARKGSGLTRAAAGEAGADEVADRIGPQPGMLTPADRAQAWSVASCGLVRTDVA
jgi:hypothetical protein